MPHTPVTKDQHVTFADVLGTIRVCFSTVLALQYAGSTASLLACGSNLPNFDCTYYYIMDIPNFFSGTVLMTMLLGNTLYQSSIQTPASLGLELWIWTVDVT